MEKIIGVYAITNVINGRQYVGGSINVLQRWSVHVTYLKKGTHYSKMLQADWDELGREAFQLDMLEETSAEELLAREQHYIDVLCPVYNVSRVSGNAFRDPAFQATLPRGRDAREYLPEHGAAISAALTGRTLSEEHCRNIGKAQEGTTRSEESNQKRSRTLKGKPKPPRTQEHRDNSSQAVKNKWEDPEYRAHMVEAAKNRKKKPAPRSQASRDQMSASRKTAWERQRQEGYTGMEQDEKGRFKPKSP
jgi:group I intron endonuclease